MTFFDLPEMHIPIQGIEDIKIPRFVRVRQTFDSTKIEDIPARVKETLDNLKIDKNIKGKTVAITVGSRGIPDSHIIVRTMGEKIREWGGEPFVVPAMGSHGGGTAEGNLGILTSYGITEEAIGMPIKASMDVVLVGELEDDAHTPVYCDRIASEADYIVLYNKVKPHTNFHGYVESGICKMVAIGIAKHVGCSYFHRQGFETFAERVPMVAKEFIAKMPVLFGLGVVQNAYDDISEIEAFEPENILEGDHKLLEIARARLPQFKFKDLDVLVIDRIGKNISGAGADPNVTGRTSSPGFEGILNCQKMFVRGLTPESHHNATGISITDITTRRCNMDIDWEQVYINLTTNNLIKAGAMPMYANNDFEALRICIKTCVRIDYSKVRIARILNTLEMSEFEVSEALAEQIKDIPGVEIISEPYELTFGEDGYMEDFDPKA